MMESFELQEQKPSTDATVNPFNGDVTDDELIAWLHQFAPEHREFAERLLRHFRYYSSRKVFALLKDLHARVLGDTQTTPSRMWFVPFGYVAKSGSAIAYFYRRQNALPHNRFIAAQDLRPERLRDVDAVVLLDDFIGSGHDAVRAWSQVIEPLARAVPSCKFVFACLVGYERGLTLAQKSTGLHLAAVDIIPENERPFIGSSSIFPTETEREAAREAIAHYGAIANPKEPLGYEASQALVGFFFSTPNNTLPVFWARENNWRPILPHGESLRDPAQLLGPPAGLPSESLQKHPRRAMIELDELAKYDIPVETARRVLEEFQTTTVFLALAFVIHELNLSREVVEHAVNLIRSLKDATHEREPVTSACLIVPIAEASQLRGLLFVKAPANCTLGNTSEVESLALLVDGYEGALGVLADGTVLGGFLYEADVARDNEFLPSRYGRAASQSRKTDGLLVLFCGRGRAQVFFRGQRLLSHRNATWHVHSGGFSSALESLAAQHGVQVPVLIAVARVALVMSDAGQGALFTVGDAEAVNGLATKTVNTTAEWVPASVTSADLRAVAALARQDGATIIAANGVLLRGGVFLHPPADIAAEKQVGKGSRHDTAVKVSAATKALAIAVSVDGQVSFFSNGALAFKFMG